jgi:transcriptional regulator with XRE-family HTH domain
MITAPQLRAARALLGIDQVTLADLAGLSLPTIQRMETSGGLIRGNVDSLTRVVQALDAMGVELLGEGSASAGEGRGVRLRERAVQIVPASAKRAIQTERTPLNFSGAVAQGTEASGPPRASRKAR